jgi:hypothetical protein
VIIVIFLIAALVSAPIGAAIVVSIASITEDRRRSLGRQARGPVERAARRLVDFHTETADWPLPKSYGQPAGGRVLTKSPASPAYPASPASAAWGAPAAWPEDQQWTEGPQWTEGQRWTEGTRTLTGTVQPRSAR